MYGANGVVMQDILQSVRHLVERIDSLEHLVHGLEERVKELESILSAEIGEA